MSDFRIDPSTTSTNLDYGENPDKDARQQQNNSGSETDQQKNYIDHDAEKHASDTQLKSRKTKKKNNSKKKRKLNERRTRQNDDENTS